MINSWITLLLPLGAAIWLFLIIRRNALQHQIEGHYNDVLRVVFYFAGFWISFLFATYIGLYLYAKGSYLLALIGLYISGLLGALVPYRIRAKEGNASAVGWLVTALVYAVLFYVVTWVFR
jgi:hypothetical protein